MTGPQPQQQQQQQDLKRTVQILATINQLSVKAFKSKKLQNLIFIILNDTVPIVGYDRAVLWKMQKNGKPQLMGVSGQASISKLTDLSKRWYAIVRNIKEPEKPQEIVHPDISEDTTILWMPIFAHDTLVLGLWLERWNHVKWRPEEIEVLKFLLVSYGAAYEKFYRRYSLKTLITKKHFPYILGIVVLLLMFVRVPLRVIAPAEIIAKDPEVITAPLEGIIEKIVVRPGQEVQKGDLLFEYDKRVPLQDLKVAAKKVEIIKAEVDRATAESQRDKKALAELAVEALKLKKEQLELELAQFHASQLNVYAPIQGITMLDSPEDWEGKPVKMGERVLIIANPQETRVRMWIPEDDNIEINLKEPIKVFLNIKPEKGLKAKIIYVASYTHVTEKSISSFVAEADWVEKDSDEKLGLKGTAVLYGENVSLFYWIIRKPWSYVRRYIGF